VELLVSVGIIGLVVVLLVGAFSSGLVQSSLTRRDAAANATIRYELEAVAAAGFQDTPNGYSECFTIDADVVPRPVAFMGSCRNGESLRADVSEFEPEANVQQWTVTVRTWPQQAAVGKPVATFKVNR
jgi:hypothetical protein